MGALPTHMYAYQAHARHVEARRDTHTHTYTIMQTYNQEIKITKVRI